MTPEELRSLQKAATEQPWTGRFPPGDAWIASAYPGPVAAFRATGYMNAEFVVAKGLDPDDARYIVAACNALPGLLDVLDAAEKWRDTTKVIETGRAEDALALAVDAFRGERHEL